MTFAHWNDIEWVITNAAIKIYKGKTVFLRLLHVTDCPGSPRPKRLLSDAAQDSPSPSPIRRRSNRLLHRLGFVYLAHAPPSSNRPVISPLKLEEISQTHVRSQSTTSSDIMYVAH